MQIWGRLWRKPVNKGGTALGTVEATAWALPEAAWPDPWFRKIAGEPRTEEPEKLGRETKTVWSRLHW